MPKQSYELTTFNEGMVSHPDPEDLTINSATYSRNLDSVAPAGTLGAKKNHGKVFSTSEPFTSAKLVLDQKVGIDVNDPDYFLVYFSPALGQNGAIETEARIGFIENFYDVLEEVQ
tara:strand:+ start:275 stop:622 length:348 start_codon:yes stop_codon:yes gene_type:complete